jgi:hypothetical protein
VSFAACPTDETQGLGSLQVIKNGQVVQCLAPCKASRRETLAFVARLPDVEIQRTRTQDRWSVKDVLAHLLGCDEETVRRLKLIARGPRGQIEMDDRSCVPAVVGGPNRGQLRFDGSITAEPQDGPWQVRKPGFVKGAAPHLGTAFVVAPRPVDELGVRAVERPAGSESLLAIALDLTGPQAGESNLGGYDEKDNQVKLRNETVSPATE